VPTVQSQTGITTRNGDQDSHAQNSQVRPPCDARPFAPVELQPPARLVNPRPVRRLVGTPCPDGAQGRSSPVHNTSSGAAAVAGPRHEAARQAEKAPARKQPAEKAPFTGGARPAQDGGGIGCDWRLRPAAAAHSSRAAARKRPAADVMPPGRRDVRAWSCPSSKRS
jgi:hypothetical protein